MSNVLLSYAAPSVAIEIASRRLTVAEVTGSGGKTTVSAFASEPLVSDAIQPSLTGVNIPDIASVGEALKRALDRAGLKSVRRAALIVPDSIARVSLVPFEQL